MTACLSFDERRLTVAPFVALDRALMDARILGLNNKRAPSLSHIVAHERPRDDLHRTANGWNCGIGPSCHGQERARSLRPLPPSAGWPSVT